MPADRIELRGLRAWGTHGALPDEQRRPQPFEVDLDLVCDLSFAGRTDDLDDTVDYAALAEQVVEIVSHERHALLERLAERIAAAALAAPQAQAVAVTVRKLRPPVAVDLATAGVTITRTRPATLAGQSPTAPGGVGAPPRGGGRGGGPPAG